MRAATTGVADAQVGVGESAAGRRRMGSVRLWCSGTRACRACARALTDRRIAAAALIAIVACAAIVVLAAADRPSVLSATTTANYFPHWMAGPLGGLWPWLPRDPKIMRDLFTGALVVMYGSYLLGLRYAPHAPARWTIAAIVAVHVVLFLSPPLALTDVFNYVNYGRMEVVHHLNPYTTTPILEPHNDPAFSLSNWHQLLSPYGPLFTLITFVVVPLGLAGSFWALKAILMVASLSLILVVWKTARLLADRVPEGSRLRCDPVAAIALVGLNPIVILWGLGGDHNDFITMLFVMLAFYLLLRAGLMPGAARAPDKERAERARALRFGAGAALATAVALKASAGILIPIVLAPALRRSHRRDLAELVAGLAVGGLIWSAASVLAFGPHLPDLATQGRLVTMESLPNLLGLALLQGGETTMLRLILSGVLVASIAACSVLAYRRRESLTGAGWATVALLVTLSWVLPWYVLWLLPLAALAGSRRLRLTALVLGVYFIAAWSPVSGGLLHGIGFHPEKTSLGRLHQRYVKELLF
ncbi:MAG TPA: polyprenol phosphomannose-dependent alpha 1,6 mannosyltransferase MptB [Solirubrobacteraceae bacterium]|jgi:hypothetical protein|nr:polyprenol phosphomannose-dependent alpha 1,6 mannosyltransferase MptB [Solirubrobacteraceae bacterium]